MCGVVGEGAGLVDGGHQQLPSMSLMQHRLCHLLGSTFAHST